MSVRVVPRIEDVPQAVAEEVDARRHQHDGQTGKADSHHASRM